MTIDFNCVDGPYSSIKSIIITIVTLIAINVVFVIKIGQLYDACNGYSKEHKMPFVATAMTSLYDKNRAIYDYYENKYAKLAFLGASIIGVAIYFICQFIWWKTNPYTFLPPESPMGEPLPLHVLMPSLVSSLDELD